MQFPLKFTIPSIDGEMGWGRAQTFIGQYSSMKLQVATDYILQTYSPNEIGQFGYYVTRVQLSDGTTAFTVQGLYKSSIFYNGSDKADLNAHVLAYYIATGKLNALIHR